MARIEDHALISDCHSAALVRRDGTINWLCLPRFDSAACFASLLGTRDNGEWRIAPAVPVSRVTRRYRGDTMVLETVFETASGVVALIDFMRLTTVIRIVEGRGGSVPCRFDFVPRMNYGGTVPAMTAHADGKGGDATLQGNTISVRSDVALTLYDAAFTAEFEVAATQRVHFSLSYPSSHPAPTDLDAALEETETYWRAWSDRCTYTGQWQAAVRRSVLTLKALIHRPSGGMAAAATTSLPEWIGAERNWDYRCCWPRDTSFALLALADAGHTEEFSEWSDWLARAVKGSPAQLQSLYGLEGERSLPEREIPWLAGYENPGRSASATPR